MTDAEKLERMKLTGTNAVWEIWKAFERGEFPPEMAAEVSRALDGICVHAEMWRDKVKEHIQA